jgi:hypothetical protein
MYLRRQAQFVCEDKLICFVLSVFTVASFLKSVLSVVLSVVFSVVFLRDHRAVLRMFTLANRATGQPWLTELLCTGCPLPSLKAPPS